MDQAGMLSPGARSEIENLVRSIRSAGGTQLQVLTVPTLDGTPIEQASIKITDAWKLGSQQSDDGVLLLISAKERAMRIEVGQGREGVLPDVVVKRIISSIMIPHFKNGDVDQGVLSGIVYIFKYSDPEILEKVSQYGAEVPTAGNRKKSFPFFLIFILLYIVIQTLGLGRRRSALNSGAGGFLTGMILGGGLGRGGFGGGGFGGSGGGWGGGGGGFSGGGASGDW